MEEHILQAHALLAARTTADRRAHSEDPADPDTVQAMQIALHLPKNDAPDKTAVLEAAAKAVVQVCLDPRAVTDDAWRRRLTTWYDHLIRKVVRRARNKQWEDVQGLPGITVTTRGAQVRAFLPSAVADVPAEIKKLQIRGTELPSDDPGPIGPEIPLIVIDRDLAMSAGKAAAQVGHGSMLLAAQQPAAWVVAWARDGYPLQVREVAPAEMQRLSQLPGAVAIRDAGFTEVAPDSLTVVALPASA